MKKTPSKKVKLGLYPTPLHYSETLSSHWKRNIWLKREDLSGFMGGGNKVRQAEYLIGEALSEGATDIVAAGGAQSNHLRIIAGASSHFGLKCHLALYGTKPEKSSGNLLLSKMVGGKLSFSGSEARESADLLAEQISESLRAKGHKPYKIPRGGASATGARGWVDFVQELQTQVESLQVPIDRLILPVGSGGTLAGIQWGRKVYQAPWQVTGLATSKSKELSLNQITNILTELGDKKREASRGVEIFDDFLGEGYGVLSEQVADFMKEFLKNCGLPLDPVFGAKALMGAKHLIDSGHIGEKENLILLITGGEMSLFADQYQKHFLDS